LTAEDALGKTCLELGYEPWHAALHDREIDTVIATKNAVRGEVPFNGTLGKRDYDYLFVPVLDNDGHVIAVAGTSRDITKRKELEASLRDMDRRKDEFIAMLAHELRNPVAPIRAAAEALMRLELQSRPAALSTTIRRQSDQLARLLDDLLDVTRIKQGRLELHFAKVLLGSCIESAVETTRPAIADKQLTLAVNASPEPIYVKADASRLVQCLTNLLVNAIKFSPAGSSIRVDISAARGQAIIEVKDCGIGIDANLLPHVFELFVQGHPTSDRAASGLGIGLTLCKRIMELHGGNITATSEGSGRGAEFTLYLPLAQAERAAAPEPTETTWPARRILIVDDNRDAADTLAALLELDGHCVIVAYSPEEGLDRVITDRPEIAILDIGLPGMSGFELAGRMRGMRSDIRLIALTGYALEDVKTQLDGASFDVHLVKPIDSMALRAALSQ
jgi:signal transduction histidine kinase